VRGATRDIRLFGLPAERPVHVFHNHGGGTLPNTAKYMLGSIRVSAEMLW
jgi:hypothetical protein